MPSSKVRYYCCVDKLRYPDKSSCISQHFYHEMLHSGAWCLPHPSIFTENAVHFSGNLVAKYQRQ